MPRLLAGGTMQPGVSLRGRAAGDRTAASQRDRIDLGECRSLAAGSARTASVASIEIRTRSPARTDQVPLAATCWSSAEADALAPDRAIGVGVPEFRRGRPRARLPLTFAANVSLGRMSREVPILAVVARCGREP